MIGELTVAVAPAEEPLTLDEVKNHLRYTGDAEDGALAIQLTAAREQCELVARRAFVSQTLELRLDEWPETDMIALSRPPLQSIESVTYTTEDGQTHTMPSTDYIVYANAEPGRLYVKPGKSWPGGTLMPGPAICIRYAAGYGDPEAVPLRYKQAVLLLTGTWFAVREHVTVGSVAREVPDSVRALLLTDRG
jgi:uncharacterized phiE125 gp8 family phage protein